MSTARRVQLDPEVLALIEEVARNPRSTLLRRPRHASVDDYFSGAFVRPSATGMSSAEVHLVEVYREEVAQLLVEYCRTWQATASSIAPIFARRSFADTETGVGTALPAYRRAAGELRSCGVGDPAAEQALDLLLAHESTPSTQELIALALRLAPSNEARMVAGLDLMTRERNALAYRTLIRIARTSPRPSVKSVALANSAWAIRKLDQLEKCRDLYLESYQARDGAYQSIVSAMLTCANIQDARRLDDCVREFESLRLARTDVEVRLRHLKTGPRLMPVPEGGRAFARRQANRFSGLAAELLDAYAS